MPAGREETARVVEAQLYAPERIRDALRRAVSPILGGRSAVALTSVALLLPDLIVFAGRILRDERVPRAKRGEILATALYLASPVDIFPETLFGPVGLVGPAAVATRLADVLLNGVDPALARELWPGDRALLEGLGRAAADGRRIFAGGLRSGMRLLLRRGARSLARIVTDTWTPNLARPMGLRRVEEDRTVTGA